MRDTVTYFRAQKDTFVVSETVFSYGLTDIFGIRITLPITILAKRNDNRSAGANDLQTELTCNIYLQPHFVVNILGGFTIPTGNFNKNPGLSTGSYDFTGQLTFIHSSEHWYMGHRTNFLLTRHHRDFKAGNRYSIEFGFGKRMNFHPKSSSDFYFIGQLNMILNERDKFRDIKDVSTGQAVVFFGPICSWTHPNWLIEGAFSLPIGQSRSRLLPKIDFRTQLTVEIKY